ncbi:MAG: hypothetical protein H6742_00335 [Alphaproteobacteria bacterium]|nr:hypothetical protein [Alphaproteobacteria bacterium]
MIRHLSLSLLPGLLLGLLAGCSPEPTAFDDCGRLSGTAREDCRLRFGQALLDDPAALEQALATLDPGSRDLLLLRLAVAEPARAGQLCRQVATATAAEKCNQVLGRPHLGTTPKPRQPDGAPPPPPGAP